ncbi:MAG: chemotaxis protein CheW [Pseudomonadota bacterium]
MNNATEIRTLVAPMPGGNILIPGSMIAEVVNYLDPEPFHEGPDWLLGEVRWNGWQLPVVNLALLAGTTEDEAAPPRARVLVVKTLSVEASVLHIGMIIDGLPKLKNVTTANLEEKDTDTPTGIFSHVVVDDEQAVIPDLDKLALAIEKSVYTR